MNKQEESDSIQICGYTTVQYVYRRESGKKGREGEGGRGRERLKRNVKSIVMCFFGAFWGRVTIINYYY